MIAVVRSRQASVFNARFLLLLLLRWLLPDSAMFFSEAPYLRKVCLNSKEWDF